MDWQHWQSQIPFCIKHQPATMQQCNNATTMPAVTTHSTTHRPPLPPPKKKSKAKRYRKKKTKKAKFCKTVVSFVWFFVFDSVWFQLCSVFRPRFYCILPFFVFFVFFFGFLALLASQRCAVAARPLLLLLLGARYKSFQLSLERVTVKTYNLGAEVSSFSIPLFARI